MDFTLVCSNSIQFLTSTKSLNDYNFAGTIPKSADYTGRNLTIPCVLTNTLGFSNSYSFRLNTYGNSAPTWSTSVFKDVTIY